MSTKIGSVRLSGASGEMFLGRDMGHGRDYSDQLASVIDTEVRGLMDSALREATVALSLNRHVLDRIALELLDKETLNEVELEEIFKDIVKVDARESWLSGEWVANAPADAKAPAIITVPDAVVETPAEAEAAVEEQAAKEAEEESAPAPQLVEPKDEV